MYCIFTTNLMIGWHARVPSKIQDERKTTSSQIRRQRSCNLGVRGVVRAGHGLGGGVGGKDGDEEDGLTMKRAHCGAPA